MTRAFRKPTQPARQPHDYQRRAVEWLLGHCGAALFLSPGLGKTSIVLRALLTLKDSKIGKRALVLAPLRVAHEVWPREAEEWAGTEWERLRELRCVFLHGKDKDKLIQQDAEVFVVNYDGLEWLFSDMKRFRALGIDTLVADESSYLKHTRTKRFKLLKPMLNTFARRWILTGSPISNGFLDIFGQIFVIDSGAALSPYITHFRQEFFSPVDRFGWEWRLKPGADKLIEARIAPYVMRLEAEDYVKMPAVVENVVRVELPPAARKVYDKLEEELFAELEGGRAVTALGAGAAAVKCSQAANGSVYADREGATTEREVVKLHDAKTDAVEELLAENDAPALCIYEYAHDLSKLRERFGKDVPNIGGGTSLKETARLVDEWNAGRVPLLLCQPAAMSHGINMQKSPVAPHIIFHSLIYDYERADQLIRRVRRQGSRHAEVWVHYVVARNTIDEAKLRALRKKEKTQKDFLAALREYAKNFASP